MIPKVIHYCWFGGNPKPELVERCIASWKTYCPNWKIIEWNESNYDVKKIPYLEEAYQAGKWAFVSDYARLDIIFHSGGVYLDTDVELFAEPTEWLDYDASFAFETGRVINTGLGFAAEKGSQVVSEMMKSYDNAHFIEEGRMNLYPCPEKNTQGLCAFSPQFKRNGQTQTFDGIKILSFDDYHKVAKHHYTGSWGNDADKKNGEYKATKWKSFLRRPSHFDFIEKLFGKRVLRWYTFFCYDLQEYGMVHFARRIINRSRRK